MKNKLFLQYLWPIFGIIVMYFSAHLLYAEFCNPHSELSHLSMEDLILRLKSISNINWIGAIICTAVAYASLAGYDRIALEHLKREIPWWFIGASSFSAYALSHSIGASVFSGAAIRYRAYSSKGLSASEVAVLVGFCSFTFALGIIILLAICLFFQPKIILIMQPEIAKLLHYEISSRNLMITGFVIATAMLAFIVSYIFGSWLHLKPLKIGKHIQIFYPNLKIVTKQLIIGPLEILAAAGIIYFMLPSDPNITFVVVLLAFISSFTLGLLSNAPGGGLGVFELSFLKLLPNINKIDLIVAIIVFRILYIIIPLIISLIFVIIFEIKEYKKN